MLHSSPYVIGVAGGSGSGKTFFLKSFLEHFAADEITLISQDDYYFPSNTQTPEENRLYNFDLPTAIDRNAFYLDVKSLIEGETVSRREYTFNNASAKPKFSVFEPAPVIVVEGLFIFHYSEVDALLDKRIFIHADEDIALARRLERDRVERGYEAADVNYKWQHHVLPSYRAYLLPYKESSDLLIVNNNNDPFQIHAETRSIAEALRQRLL